MTIAAEPFVMKPSCACWRCQEARKVMNARNPACRACGKLLLDFTLADGCPCNSPRGVNHGIVPVECCTCKVCDPKETGSSRWRVPLIVPKPKGCECPAKCEGVREPITMMTKSAPCATFAPTHAPSPFRSEINVPAANSAALRAALSESEIEKWLTENVWPRDLMRCAKVREFAAHLRKTLGVE